jgi:hypothetical protein
MGSDVRLDAAPAPAPNAVPTPDAAPTSASIRTSSRTRARLSSLTRADLSPK